jgi:hypothetical protein
MLNGSGGGMVQDNAGRATTNPPNNAPSACGAQLRYTTTTRYVALIDESDAGPAGERGGNRRVVELGLRVVDRRLIAADLRFELGLLWRAA